MPAKLDRCVEKLIAKGHSKSSAFAICQASMAAKEAAARVMHPISGVIVKEVNSVYRWVGLSSGSFGPDRDGHWVTEKALKTWAVDFKERGYLRANGEQVVARWRHLGLPNPITQQRGPGIDLGMCDYAEYAGHTLVMSGTFIDPEVGRAWTRHKEKDAISIGFFHPKNEPQNGLYNTIDIYEVSFTVDDRASYPLTALSVIEGV